MRKALWVVRDRITTAHAIDELLADASSRGIFDLVVQVRGRGDAYYRSKLEPQALALAGSDLDPLDHLVRFGAAVGVRIHAWGNVFFVWSDKDGALPRSPSHVVNQHPDWLLRPGGVKYLDPVGGSDWEGIYTDPANAAIAGGGFIVSWSDASGSGGDDSGFAAKAQIFTLGNSAENTPLKLSVAAALTDTDGSETLAVTIKP